MNTTPTNTKLYHYGSKVKVRCQFASPKPVAFRIEDLGYEPEAARVRVLVLASKRKRPNRWHKLGDVALDLPLSGPHKLATPIRDIIARAIRQAWDVGSLPGTVPNEVPARVVAVEVRATP